MDSKETSVDCRQADNNKTQKNYEGPNPNLSQTRICSLHPPTAAVAAISNFIDFLQRRVRRDEI